MPNAFVTSAAEGDESIDQPTILREYVSSTAAQYTLPSRVRCSVMSVTHSWFGPGRANSRLTRAALMVSGGVYFHLRRPPTLRFPLDASAARQSRG